MQGRRRDPVPFGEMPDPWPEPGDYWRYLDRETGEPMDAGDEYFQRGNLTRGVWGVCAPGGEDLLGLLRAHTVREHEDGTISVREGDGSSNSILIVGGGDRGTFHGFIEHGVWRSC